MSHNQLVADKGFSGGGEGAPTLKVGVLAYFFGRKLHENERIWIRGRCPWRPLRSVTAKDTLEYTSVILYLNVTEELHTRPYMVTERRCLDKTFPLGHIMLHFIMFLYMSNEYKS